MRLPRLLALLGRDRLIGGLVLALACLLSIPLGAQGGGRMACFAFGYAQGLSNPVILTMEQDDLGLMWVGTQGGLFRLEGQHFRRFGAEEGLAASQIQCLARDGGGGLWVGADDGLYHFSGSRFHRLGPEQGLPTQSVGTLLRDPQGQLWVTVGGDLYVGGLRDGFRSRTPVPKEPIRALAYESRSRTILVASREGRLYRAPLGSSAPWEAVAPALPAFKRQPVNALVVDPLGRVWIRSTRQLFRYDPTLRRCEDLSSHLPGPAILEGTLHLDASGRLWIPTCLGLICYENETWTWPKLDLPHSSSITQQALVDRDGVLWVVGEHIYMTLGQGAWLSHRTSEGLPANLVWSVYRDRGGRLWVGTHRGVVEGVASGWKPLPFTSHYVFTAMTQGPEGSMWAGGDEYGLLAKWDSATGRGRIVKVSGDLDTCVFQSLLFDRNGTFWAAGDGAGLLRLVPSGEGLKAERQSLPGEAPGEAVLHLIQDHRGRLWVAGSSGVAVLENGLWRRLGLEAGLRAASANALAETPSGDVWISYGRNLGFSRVSYEAGRVQIKEHLDSTHGFPPVQVYAIRATNSQLWAGTSQGIFKYQDGRITAFSRGDGLPGDDCSQHALLLDPDGQLWVGTAGGLGNFRPAYFQGPLTPPRTLLTLARFGPTTTLGPPDRLPDQPYDNHSAEFRFIPSTYLNPSKVQVQARLLGFENEWREVEGDTLRYAKLPQGSYRLEVRTRFELGAWGPSDTLAFRILPPWWGTWWFRSLSVLGVTTLIFLGFRLVNGTLIRSNQALEKMVRERTLDLEQALETAESASRAKDDFLATMSHEVRTPMHAILGMTKLLLDAPLDPEEQAYAHTVQSAATALMAVMNDILDYVKIQKAEIRLREVPFDLRELLEELMNLMSATAHPKGLEIFFRCTLDGPTTYLGDPDRLRQVFLNLLGNAVKFTAQGHVLLDLERQELGPDLHRLRVRITDTGEGIPADKLPQLFQKFTQADTSIARRYGGTGLGLAITQQLVHLMGGEVGATSSPGLGSTFQVELPLAWVPGAPAPFSLPASSRCPILVAHPHPLGRSLLTERLSGWGFPCRGLEDLEGAKVALRTPREEGPYRLLLLDEGLLPPRGSEPPLSEFDVTTVLLCSVHRRLGSARLKELGFSGALGKPHRDQDLAELLAHLLSERALDGARPHPEERQPPPARAIPAGWRAAGRRILLVEDNPLNQQVVLRMLADLEAAVEVASSGQEAVERIQRHPFDLILMDVHMPGMDGLQATRAIRQFEGERHTPIIATTAHALAGDRERFLAAGMDAFLPKPFDREDLATLLARIPSPTEQPETPTPEVQVLDCVDRDSLLASLTSGDRLDLEGLEEMLGIFEKCGEGYILALRRPEAPAKELREKAHALCGSAAYLYAMALAEVCKRLEKAAAAGDLPQARALVPDVAEEYARAVQALHGLCQELKAYP